MRAASSAPHATKSLADTQPSRTRSSPGISTRSRRSVDPSFLCALPMFTFLTTLLGRISQTLGESSARSRRHSAPLRPMHCIHS